MKLFNITDTRKFFERVLRCEGAITSADRSGRVVDLKQVAEYYIRNDACDALPPIGEISLKLERDSDVAAMMTYAAQMTLEGRRTA